MWLFLSKYMKAQSIKIFMSQLNVYQKANTLEETMNNQGDKGNHFLDGNLFLQPLDTYLINPCTTWA